MLKFFYSGVSPESYHVSQLEVGFNTVLKPYANRLADYFGRFPDSNRYMEEYPAQLAACGDFQKLSEFISGNYFVRLSYHLRNFVINTIRCKEFLITGSQMFSPKPEKMCLNCSMKCTFNKSRLNKMSCYICGLTIFSTSMMIEGKLTTSWRNSEKPALKCRRHNMDAYNQSPHSSMKCILCKIHLNSATPQFNLPVVLCSVCSFGPSSRCCHVSTK